MKFTKKPITIEAVRWDGTAAGKQTIRDFVELPRPLGMDGNVIIVLTNHGLANCNPGDWVIRSPAGEYYPCSDDVMQSTYDAVPEPQEAELVPIEDAVSMSGADGESLRAFLESLRSDISPTPDHDAAPSDEIVSTIRSVPENGRFPLSADEEETTGEHKPVESDPSTDRE